MTDKIVQPGLTSQSNALLEFVQQHPRLLVITGAGCSTGAGIPDYRDANGEWKRSEPMRYQLFVADALARKRYWARSMLGWPVLNAAHPTAAHQALCRLEQSGRITQLVTQNVDGLHQRAQSTRVIDLHGRIDTVCCLQCGRRFARSEVQEQLLQRNPEWAGLRANIAPDGDADLALPDFGGFDVPDCPDCGGTLKPDVVFFGENVPPVRVQAVRTALQQSDALLVVGSSLMVYSGYRFVEEAVTSRQPVAVLNIGRTRADPLVQLKIEIEVGSALEALVEALQIN